MALNPYMDMYPADTPRKELDLREELRRLLFGASDEIPKGRTGLLRKIRRDDSGDPIRCPCRSSVTDEPDKDYYCRTCQGHGYLWDETKIVYYRNDDSFRKDKGKNQEFESDDFFVQCSKDITPDDYIVIVKLDKSGKAISPVVRERLFKVWSADEFRSDNGRVEFWRIRAQERRKWSVHYGVKIRQHN